MNSVLMTFRDGDRYELDEWTTEGKRISDPEILSVVEKAIDGGEIVAVEHWHYRGARAPSRLIFDDYEEFTEYLSEHALAGDSIHVFPLNNALKDNNQLAHGKCPDKDGKVPRKGAY